MELPSTLNGISPLTVLEMRSRILLALVRSLQMKSQRVESEYSSRHLSMDDELAQASPCCSGVACVVVNESMVSVSHLSAKDAEV